MSDAAVEQALTVTKPGVYDLPHEVYLADPVPDGSLSASGARRLLPPSSPAHFRYEREHPPAPTPEFTIGHAAHRLALGAGPDLVVVDAPDWRRSETRAQREVARADGKVPVLRSEYEQVQAMADVLRAHPIASELLCAGTPEASLFWTDGPIWRRARLDWLPDSLDGRMIVPDYKTAVTANPDQWARSAAAFGYHQQAAWYMDAVVALELAVDPAFVFIVQEKSPPYLVSVIQLDATAIRIGRELNRRAIDIYTECRRLGEWPGYVDDVALVSLPAWYERAYEGGTL